MALNNILLVEDDPDIQVVARMSLKMSGIAKITVVSNGEECLAKVAEVKPDLILLDVMMPKMDGYETCKRLKADPETQSIPVIFLTAKAQQFEVSHGLKMGAAGYLIKPFNPSTLHDEILSLLSHAHG
jgi:two-component system, OmpR family, response regulator